jgi:hypothetical protein
MNDEDFKKLVMGEGIVETAVSSVRLLYDDMKDPGLSVVEFIKGQKASAEPPLHWWPNTFEKDQINPKLIERACGAEPTLVARAELRKAAGPALYAEILNDWGCSEKTLVPGKNPKDDHTLTVDKAKKIVANEGENNPFNPRKMYPGGDASRQNEIAKFIVRFGAAASARSAARFGVDLAGRALRKRA